MADGAFTVLLLFCNFIFVFSFIDFINVLTTSFAKYNTDGKCAVTAKITDRKTSHDVQLQSGYEPTCRDDHWKSHYDGDCDLRKWSPGTFKYPAIEDDPLRWG